MSSSTPRNRFSASSINTPREFRDIITREVERADRYRLRLSLAIFEVSSSDEGNIIVRRLIRTLQKRLRSADAIGWFAKKHIGVLLPHTPELGAMRVTEDVYQLMFSASTLPPFTIYTYPSDSWPIRPKNKLASLFSWLETLFPFSGRHAIPSEQETRATLELEIDRAIRHQYLFSLLLIDVSEVKSLEKEIRAIAWVVNTCLRDTDEFGWYDDARLAVILPYASYQEAMKISERILERTPQKGHKKITVFTYPDRWLTLEQNGEQTPPSARTKEKRTAPAPEPPAAPTDQRTTKKKSSQSELDYLAARPMPLWKRGMDFVGAGIGLLLTSPLFLIAAIGIKLTSPGPIFYSQTRVGFQKKRFQLIKFRSMREGSDPESHKAFMRRIIAQEADRPETKIKDDDRIFPFGRLLRRTSIDELPQLINVLKGEMSLVGPRPCLEYEAELYEKWHTRRFSSVPGLTGLWQVSGKNRLSFKQMIRLDIQYQKHLSFPLDLKIILKTFPTVVEIFFEKDT